MKGRYQKILGISIMVLCAGILIWLLLPRSFSSAMGKGFEPDRFLGVDATLIAVPTEAPFEHRILTVDLQDSTDELLALLNQRNYIPLPMPGNTRQLTLTYEVHLCFSVPDGVYCMRFTGDDPIEMTASTPETGFRERSYRTAGGQAFQQEILDFLLKQAV